MTEAIKDAVHFISLVGVAHIELQGCEFVVQLADASAASNRFIHNGTTLHIRNVLAKVADRQLLGDGHHALVGSFLANHHPEERCLTRPVRTYQSDFFAGIELKGSVHKQQLLAILLINA